MKRKWMLVWEPKSPYPFLAKRSYGPDAGDFGWYKFGPLFLDWERR